MYLAHARMLVSRKEARMKKDAEVLMMKRERYKGKTQEQAAAASGMSTRTLRTYEQGGVLPSERKHPIRIKLSLLVRHPNAQ
jgi:DNA-binding XRE family transcriptional regulator